MVGPDVLAEAEALLALLRRRDLMVATAESCTGGLIAAALTSVAGSSDVVACGFVTYSNAAKTAMLGVPPTVLQAHGAVSEAVALRMAEGALERSEATLAVAVTGIAGPGGGSAEKPRRAGLVRRRPARRPALGGVPGVPGRPDGGAGSDRPARLRDATPARQR